MVRQVEDLWKASEVLPPESVDRFPYQAAANGAITAEVDQGDVHIGRAVWTRVSALVYARIGIRPGENAISTNSAHPEIPNTVWGQELLVLFGT